MPPAPHRSAPIDGLRGLAALSVLLYHLWLYARPVPPAGAPAAAGDWPWYSGRLGLILFFVISGYLLYAPWVAAARGEREMPRIGAYFRRRAARILPAYYVALAGAVALVWGLGSTPGVRLPPADGLPLFLVFGQNLGHGTALTLDPPMWTLCVEVSFYLALPLIGLAAARLAGGRHRQLAIPVTLLAAGVAWNTWVAPVGAELALTKLLPAMLPFFALGMIAAVLRQGRELGRTAAAALGVLFAAGLGADIAIAVFDPVLSPKLHDLPAATGFAALVALAGSSRSPVALARRPLVALGTVSYGIYLWHVPLIWWLRGEGLLPLDPGLALLVVLPLTLLVATASWTFIERPALAWGRSEPLASRPAATVIPH
jgi:peptidoglycan/LPS O-acetylase OafA/YrhL